MIQDLAQRVLVRRSTPADAQAVIDCVEAVCAEGILQTDTFIIDRHWEAVLHHPESVPQHLLAVAELDGKLIGNVRLFSGMYGSKDRHVADLGILVLSLYRDAGVGKRLMAYAIDWAIGQGLKKITLSVAGNNQRAIHLYKGCGFELEGRRKMQYNIGGEYVDELLMAKFL
jgi:putative acetyltransferase